MSWSFWSPSSLNKIPPLRMLLRKLLNQSSSPSHPPRITQICRGVSTIATRKVTESHNSYRPCINKFSEIEALCRMREVESSLQFLPGADEGISRS